MSRTEEKAEGKAEARLKIELTTIIASLALTMSIISLYQSSSYQKDSSGTDMIKNQYATYHELSRLEIENPQLSHVFAAPSWYGRAVKSVGTSVGPLDEKRREELLLKERAIARTIFTHYESLFYQWRHASRMGDAERVAFLGEALDYYTGRVLRNPRLLYLWSEKGASLEVDFEQETREHYGAHVLRDPSRPLKERPDDVGAFEPVR
jgi:hypothetical protein